MGTKVNLTDITSGYAASTTINTNNTTIENEFDNCLSLDGTAPNSMGAELDMNSNKIINVADGVDNQDAVTISQLNAYAAADLSSAPATAITLADGAGEYNASTVEAAFLELTSQGTSQGASIIGIEDAGGHYIGTKVEAALQELGAVYSGTGEVGNLNTTVGTAVNFTGIPAGVDKIELAFNDMSMSASDDILIQLGDSGGYETTGYEAQAVEYVNASNAFANVVSTSAGFPIPGSSASDAHSGIYTFIRVSGNKWVGHYVAGNALSSIYMTHGGGRKELSGELTSLRITTAAATATFDSGVANVFYTTY